MIVRTTGPRSHRDAPALRFLLLCLGGWTLLRVLMNWSAVVPAAPGPAGPSWQAPPPVIAAPAVPPLVEARQLVLPPIPVPRRITAPAARRMAQMWSGPDGDAVPSLPLPLQQQAGTDSAAPPPVLPPAALPPLPARAPLAGWSLSGWLYVRGAAPDGIAAGGQIGGSQAGVRLAHGFGATGRTRAYGRATAAVRRLRQRELAVGVAHAPMAGVPFDIAVERRVAVGREGRDAFAAMVAGGVSERRLSAGFRLDAYAQAGVVGATRRDAFADGALVADKRLGGSALRLGALAAGAVQPDAARVDVGPRLTLGLPRVGQGARIALDWRQRVAGGARPGSGLALTLAADF
jgi:hypothetical protein